MVAAGALRLLGLRLARVDADDGRAERLRPAAQELSDAARGGMDQNDVAGFHGVDVMQQETRGHALQQQRGGRLVAEKIRQAERAGRLASSRIAA